MQQVQGDYLTKNIYISDLPQNISEKEIVGFVIWVSPVYKIKFPLEYEIGEKKNYVVVTLFRPVSFKSALSILKGKTLRGKKVSIAVDFVLDGRDYSDIRNTLAELLPGRNAVDFASAEIILLELLETISHDKLNSRKPLIIRKLKEYAKIGIELNKETIIRIIDEAHKPKTKNQQKTLTKGGKVQAKKKKRRKKKKPGLIIISTPMGGQPPRKRRG